MSSQDVNPFADPNDINPFATPTTNQADLDDYNPFEAQSSKQAIKTPSTVQEPIFVPKTIYTASKPATIEPTRAEQPSYGSQTASRPFSGGYGSDDTMRQRQDELERKAAELEKKEQELKRLQGGRPPNNFPPLPKFCCVQPCFYNDINVEIPIENQKTCKMFFYLWELYAFTLFLNLFFALIGLIQGVENGATLFGVAILYFVLFIPCSFVFWYRPIYKALRSDSSFNYMLFFFVFFFQILFTFVYSLGISQFGTCGWINGAQALDSKKGKAVGAMFFICGGLFTFIGICQVLLLRKVHNAYRRSGASMEKAQSEFASGVASNKNDPSVVNQSQRNQPSLDDYNPFDGTAQQKQTPVFTPQPPPYTPATIEPVQAETQKTFHAKPFGEAEKTSAATFQRQDELEKKAADLERREQELRQAEARGNSNINNFPPLPKFCCVQPCFYHDISLDIPSASQTTCRLLFYTWQLYILALLMNLLTSIAYLSTGGTDGGALFGVAILLFVVNIPLSFVCWYRPIYKALRSDSSFSYMVFFFVSFCNIVLNVIWCIGINGVSIGWINGVKYYKTNKAVSVMCMVTAALWTLCAIFQTLLLIKVHKSYRNSGASFQKAQGEFAHGVASNKQVQKAAAQAVVEGASKY